jgi:mRNA-degrading endonuclease RelE of RelBE toxin-antitoxin system
MKCIAQCYRTPEMGRDIKKLKGKFRNVKQDIIYVERLLEAGTIQVASYTAPYPGFGKHRVFKTRVENTDSSKGKSSGYRLIYEECDSTDDMQKVLLVLVYDHNRYKDESRVKAEILSRLRAYWPQ